MKQVQIPRWEAFDGQTFDTPAKCTAYECERILVNQWADQLVPRPKDDGCAFANGTGYIQHDPARLKVVTLAVLERLLQEFEPQLPKPPVGICNTADKEVFGLVTLLRGIRETYPPSREHIHNLHYYQDRCGMIRGPIMDIIGRFYCIDFAKAREFGQPFYVVHQDQVKGGAISGEKK